jgi:hypothetical protein
MKDTPITNEYIHLINESIEAIELFLNYEHGTYVVMYPKDDIADLKSLCKKLFQFKTDDVKQEFVDTLEDYSKIFFQKKLFEFKFEKLLNWEFNHLNDVVSEHSIYNMRFLEFKGSQTNYGIDIETKDFYELQSQFVYLCSMISRLKYRVQKMLDEYETIGEMYVESANLTLIATQTEETFQKSMAHTLTEVKIASKHKTDVIKILSAMYDSKMFVNADGKPQSNKEKMMVAFGEFLGEDFSKYSASLSQAKNYGIETFMKPLQDLEKAFKKYLNFTANK